MLFFFKKKTPIIFGIVKIKCVLYIVINHKRLTLTPMKIIKGHLTAKDKQVVRHFLENGITEGRVGRTDFHLSEKEGVYTLKKRKKDRGMCPVPGSKLRLRTTTHKFTL